MLIIDDDADTRALMSTIFDRAGVTYDTVDAGEPALQSAAGRRPSVYVLDARMPDLHGHEVCRRLKADPRTQAPVLGPQTTRCAAPRSPSFKPPTATITSGRR